MTYCRVGGAWFWLSVSFKLLTILYAHIVHTTTRKVYTLAKEVQILSSDYFLELSPETLSSHQAIGPHHSVLSTTL